MNFIFDYIAQHSTDQIFIAYWEMAIPYTGVVLFPESKITKYLVYIWAFVFGILYLGLILYRQPDLLYMVYHSYGTADGFKELASDPYLHFAIYLQIITWDLLMTYWISMDAKRIGIPLAARIPFLLVFMNLPPFCFSAYMILRWLKTRQIPTIGTASNQGQEAQR